MSDPRPIGVFDSGVGGLTVLREIVRRSPHESTIYLGDNARAPYGVRPDEQVLTFSTQSLDALVERDVKALVVACNTSTAVGIARTSGGATTCRSWASSGRAPRRRRWPPATVASGSSPRRRRSARMRTSTRSRTRTRPSRSTSTPPRTLVPMVEAGELSGPTAEATVAASLAAAARRARRGRRVDLPAPGRRDDRHAPARLHALPAAGPDHRGHRRRGRGDRRFGHRHRVRPGRAAQRQRPREPRATGTPRPIASSTTGDAGRPASGSSAGRLFGTDFPDVESVELGVLAG